MKTAIVVPAYNEELTIEKVIVELHNADHDVSIYVVDNNSNDETNKIARKTLRKIGCKGEVIFEERQGKANAIRRAFQKVDADIYVIVDADLTYSAEDMGKLVGPIINNEADMTVGDRHFLGDYSKENKRIFHNFGNNLVKILINFLFQSNLNDIMSGYRAVNKYFVDNYPVLCEGFEIETEITLHALDKRFRIVEVPIRYKDRPDGSRSKLNTFKDGLIILKTIFWILKYYKPLIFFGFLSLLFFIFGLAIGMRPILEFMQTGLVNRQPSAILATGLMILSITWFAIGVILDTVVRFHRFNYELRLQKKSDLQPKEHFD